MNRPFTKESAAAAGRKSGEARRRKREQVEELEQKLAKLAEGSPMHAAILRYFQANPRAWEDVVKGIVKQASNGNVRAFEALANRTDGPPTQRHEIEETITLDPAPWLIERQEQQRQRELQLASRKPEPSFQEQLAAYEAGRSLPAPAEPVQTIEVSATPATAEPAPAPLPQTGTPLDPNDENIPLAYRDGTVIYPLRRHVR